MTRDSLDPDWDSVIFAGEIRVYSRSGEVPEETTWGRLFDRNTGRYFFGFDEIFPFGRPCWGTNREASMPIRWGDLGRVIASCGPHRFADLDLEFHPDPSGSMVILPPTHPARPEENGEP
jgi:hypothetical protein